jgi:cysteine desulfurase
VFAHLLRTAFPPVHLAIPRFTSHYCVAVTYSAYLDAASAVPLHPAAREALQNSLDEGWADPSRLYTSARRARLLLDTARQTTADCLGVRPDEVAFCANGTQAAQVAVLGGLAGRSRSGDVLVHSAIEHSAVLHAAEKHVSGGGRVISVGVDHLGRIDTDAFTDGVQTEGTALAAVMTASHEVGTLQPWDELAEICLRAGVPLYTDAAQTAGWSPLPAGCALASASAHKWGGPPGVGILVIRKRTRWKSPWPDDEREAGRIPGAQNVPGIVAAAAALRAVVSEQIAEKARLHRLVDRIRTTVAATIPDVEVVGDPVERLPHLVTFSCLYVDGEALLHALDARGFAVSSGSSCTSSTLAPSHVLEAMGVLSHGNIRVSLHRETAEEDVDRFLKALPGIVRELRESAGVTDL